MSKVKVTAGTNYSEKHLLLRYLKNDLRDLDLIWYESQLWGGDELIRFWLLKVKGQGHCGH